MTKVVRYDPNPGTISPGHMREDADGEYVKYKDYERVLKLLKQSKAKNKSNG